MIKKEIIQDKKIFFALFIYSCLLLFFCSKMSPLYPFNEWSDINLYFNIGKAIFNGRTLYTEAFDHKGPLIFFIYGIGYLISNASFLGMYFIECIFWTIMIFAAYLTARLYLEKIYAFLVALVFPVIMLTHSFNGGSAEEFIVVLQVISLYLFILYFKDKGASVHNPVYMFIHGGMCAITLLIKINLVMFWFFPLAAIFINILLKREYRNLIKNLIAFFCGILLIILPICIYLLVNGAFSEAWYIYIDLNGTYAMIGDISRIIENIIVRFYQKIRFETIGFSLVLLGAIYFPIRYIGNKWGKIAIPLSFLSIFTSIFITSNQIFAYYSIPYDAYTLLACIIIFKHVRVSSSKKVYILSFLIVLIIGIKQKDFFGAKLDELISRKSPPTLIDSFSAHVIQEKNPTLLNLGLNLGNGVFTKANIMPNVKYFISPNLHYVYYPQMRNEQTKYIENRQVQFIILCTNDYNYEYFSTLPALNEYYTIIDENDGGGIRPYYLYKLKDEAHIK
jgi:hypothetical protein